MRNLRPILSGTLILVFAAVVSWAARDDAADYPFIDFDNPVIGYNNGTPQDAVTRLQEKMDRGEVQLEFDSKQGYLPSLLKQLDITVDSQMLVFSKTSFQAPKISPQSPRGLYFNDEAAIGFVPTGDVLELTALDPNRGINFYTIERNRTERPRFVRHGLECMNCHLIANTLYVPGLLATSVIPRPDGSPRFVAAATVVDSRTPLDQRWGGWYVTGQSGELRHRGNAFAPNPDRPSVLDLRNAQNLMTLKDRFDTSRYPLPTSDLVALLTLEHQNRMTSLITRLNWEARIAQQEGGLDAFAPRLQFLADEMVAYMLFQDEARISDPITGSSTFVKTFPQRGPRDKKGRSLRDFDLQTRVFRYPLSYMIYSDAFEALPSIVKDEVYRKLFAALNSEPTNSNGRLSAEDRGAILEILVDTKPGLPSYWTSDK